jgi:glutaredoxin 3
MATRAAIWLPALALATALGAGVADPDLPLVGPWGAALRALAPGGGGEGGGPGLRTYYQFVDATGRVRFVETLAEVPVPLRASAGRVEMEGPPPGSPAEARAAAARMAAANAPGPAALPVTVYVTSWCPHCKAALADLDRRGIQYTKRDIDADADAKAALRAKTGGTGVPMLEVGNQIVRGYSVEAYARVFDRAG